MTEKQIELQQYLEGLHQESPIAFFHLAEILKYQAFELCEQKEIGTLSAESGSYLASNAVDYFIPYMMNDALEYYLILKKTRMTGTYLPDRDVISAQIARHAKGYVLILRQAENLCTLHFEKIEERAQCYQYHRIGHFWVKGQEQWRQLVYIVGTIYDKYEYFGEQFCNQKELEILNLIRFAPFREWSPIRESLEEQYPNADEGLEVMRDFAVAAGDKSYLRFLWLYRYFPFRCMTYFLSRQLLSPKRQKLYNLIYQKIEAASEAYPERDYGSVLQAEIEKARRNVSEILTVEGYIGKYPYYRKEEIQIIATEEHPFTILEQEDFKFRIQLMLSENKQPKYKRWKHNRSMEERTVVHTGECEDERSTTCINEWMEERNAGFFKGKGRNGWIVSLEEINKKE